MLELCNSMEPESLGGADKAMLKIAIIHFVLKFALIVITRLFVWKGPIA